MEDSEGYEVMSCKSTYSIYKFWKNRHPHVTGTTFFETKKRPADNMRN